MGLSGFFNYRYRETKAMSVGQFLEMRYSRSFRIFAAALRSISEMLANMIMPAVAARFFIYFLDLPEHFTLCGIGFSTFGCLIALSLVMAISIICISGDLGIVITDTLQGLLLYPLLVAFVVCCLVKFSWTQEIAPVMSDRIAGESFLNPYDIKKLRDFNFFFLAVTVFTTFLHRGSWVTGGASRARSPHEQKMAGLLGDWRGALNQLFYLLVAVVILTVMCHKDFSQNARVIRTELATRIAARIAPENKIIGKNIASAIEKIPQHDHTIGRDAPLSEKKNLDTPYLDAAHAELTKADKERGHALFQQFRTLYHQMMLAVSMRHILPRGMIGLFLLLMIMAMISTDDSRINSAAGTIAQDVILPLRKKTLTPEEHIKMSRLVAIGIGVFFFFGSFFMAQLDYINLFVTLMCVMWLGGCGPVMIFGLYSRFGNTKGAWASLLTGMGMGLVSIFLQRKWADLIYPFLEENELTAPVGDFLAAASAPLNPYVVWEMNPVKCPINSYELYLITMLVTLFLYCAVSYLTNIGHEKFNLDRMLHRGEYSIDGEKKIKSAWTRKNLYDKLIGITPEYTFWDRVIAWAYFYYSIVYRFGLTFIAILIWNAFDPWPLSWWGWKFFITTLIIPGFMAAFTAVWFGICGFIDLRQMFRDLEARAASPLDDGSVEGGVSLADKAAVDAIDKSKNAGKQ